MIGAILSIVAYILPLLLDGLFSPGAKKRRTENAFDEALKKGDADELGRLLSQRIDSVRSKGGGNP